MTEVEHGGTEVIPGSHLFGTSLPSEPMEESQWAKQVHYNLGKAGSIIMFNNQVWHRGGPNRSDRTRYITQISYARRLIGHKYYPFMNELKYKRSIYASRPIPIKNNKDNRETRIIKHSCKKGFYSILEGKFISAPFIADDLVKMLESDCLL